MLEEAKKLIELGWCVLPCFGYNKNPYPLKWQEYQTRKATVKEWEEWAKDPNLTGMCLITGKISGVVAIDIDDPKLKEKFSSNIISQTRSGGYHFFYKYSQELGNTVRISDNKVDFRGDGGLIVLPPSRAKGKDGAIGEYKWIKEPDELEIYFLPELPEEIIQSMNRNHAVRNCDNGWAEVGPSISDIDGTQEGNRNDSLFRYACMERARHPNEPEYVEYVVKKKNATFSPPLLDAEVSSVLESSARYRRPETSESDVLDYSSMTDDELTKTKEYKKQFMCIPGLDSMYDWPSGVTLICGKTNIGKTFWSLAMARGFYDYNKTKTIFFSLEMDEKQIRRRCLQSWSGLTEDEYKNNPTPEAIQRLKDSIRIIHYDSKSEARKTPKIFERDFEKWYNKGFRCFMFDHILQVDGATDNTTCQRVIKEWAGAFMDLMEKFPDCWIFVFTQERIEARRSKKRVDNNIVYMGDVQGAKSILQICDTFIGISRKTDNGVRTDDFFVHVEKSRNTRKAGFICPLYFAPDGNFYDNEGKYIKHHNEVLEKIKFRESAESYSGDISEEDYE